MTRAALLAALSAGPRSLAALLAASGDPGDPDPTINALVELIAEGLVEDGNHYFSFGVDYALTHLGRAAVRNCPAMVP